MTRIVWSRRDPERDEASNDGTICVAALRGQGRTRAALRITHRHRHGDQSGNELLAIA